MYTLLTRLARGKSFLSNVLLLASGTALGQGITVLASPILSRMYTPEEFGVLAVYLAILGPLIMVASFRYEFAIPLAEDDESAANLLVLTFILVAGTTIVSGVVLWLVRDQIVAWTRTPTLAPYLIFVPGSLLGAGLYQTLSYWTIRRRAFSEISRTKVSQGFGQVAVLLGLGYFNFGPLGLVMGDVVGKAGGSGRLAWFAFRERTHWKHVGLASLGRAALKYWRFPLFSTPSSLIGALGLQLPAILLAAFYGPRVAGCFLFSQQAIGIPAYLLQRAIGQVYYAEAARLAKGDPSLLKTLHFSLARRLLCWGGIPIAVAGLSAPWSFSLVFGARWEEAGTYTQWLTVSLVTNFVAYPLSQIVLVFQRQGLQMCWDIGRLLIVCGGIVVAGLANYAPVSAVAIFSLCSALAYASLIAISTWIVIARCAETVVETHNASLPIPAALSSPAE